MITNPDDPVANSYTPPAYDPANYGSSFGYGGMGYQSYMQPTFQQIPEHLTKKEEADRWKNRRRMAYMSLFAIFAVMGLLFFVVPSPRIDSVSTAVEWFFIVMGTIISTYIGSSTYSDVVELKNRWTGGRR